MTARSPFPDLFIVGAAKAGTSSLVDMLRDHPGVFIPYEKEPHHFMICGGQSWFIFDGPRVRPLAETLPYGTKHAYLSLYASADEGRIRIDASTQYLVNKDAAAAIFAANPAARIVICLRDPVARAYSAYLHARSRGEEPCATFGEALDQCLEGTRRQSFAINYLDEGRYAEHIAAYREHFGDRISILLFEDLIRQPQASLDHFTHFANIGRLTLPGKAAAHKNPTIALSNPFSRGFRMAAKRVRRLLPGVMNSPWMRRPYEWLLSQMGDKPAPLSAEDAKRTYALLRDDIVATEQMIGRDLSHWHRPYREGAP